MIILILPFFVGLLAIFSYYVGYNKISTIFVTYINLLYIIALDSFITEFTTKNTYIFLLGNWLEFYNILVKWEFIYNPFTLSLCFVIIGVGSSIVTYSGSYMATDINTAKFISYLSIFIFLMLWGILGNNLIILLIGWEGVGIMSYLLINFYDNRIEANKSGIKALLVNKVGDLGLLLAIISLYIYIITFKFNNINTLVFYFKYETLNIFLFNSEVYILTVVCSLFFVAISTKSAQYLFNS